jgi:hypothetical protein
MHKVLSYFLLFRCSLVSRRLLRLQSASPMATTYQFARRVMSRDSRLDPAVKEFLDAVVIPALVKAYVLEGGVQNPLATVPNDVTHFVSKESIFSREAL